MFAYDFHSILNVSMRWLCMNLFRMHLLVDQAATASSESLALSICFTPDTHGILSGILWEPLCLGHAKAKTPQRMANLSRRRTGWAAGSKPDVLPAEEVDVCPGHSVVRITTSPVSTCPAQRLLFLPGTAHVTLNLKFHRKICSSLKISRHLFFVP